MALYIVATGERVRNQWHCQRPEEQLKNEAPPSAGSGSCCGESTRVQAEGKGKVNLPPLQVLLSSGTLPQAWVANVKVVGGNAGKERQAMWCVGNVMVGIHSQN